MQLRTMQYLVRFPNPHGSWGTWPCNAMHSLIISREGLEIKGWNAGMDFLVYLWGQIWELGLIGLYSVHYLQSHCNCHCHCTCTSLPGLVPRLITSYLSTCIPSIVHCLLVWFTDRRRLGNLTTYLSTCKPSNSRHYQKIPLHLAEHQLHSQDDNFFWQKTEEKTEETKARKYFTYPLALHFPLLWRYSIKIEKC